MIRFIQKPFINSEQARFNYFKRQCKLTIATLISLQQQHHTQHCVLVIGQPESGKSMLCASSAELIFCTRIDSATEAKTNNKFVFEIYLQRNILLLHIPQDFFLFNETRPQHRAWHFLGKQFKHQRPYLPISRCLISIDLYDFSTRSEISNNTRFSQIALGLNAITRGLKNKLNVTLFFTKVDLIAGFNEFFDHESHEFLAQPWGISLVNSTADTLVAEYEQLIKKLNRRLLWRLHHEVNLQQLHLIKNFPLILENIKNKIIKILPGFLEQCSHSKFITPTQLYFVSCCQFKELTDTTHLEAMTEKNKKNDSHKHFFIQQVLEAQQQHHAININHYIEKITKIIFVTLCTLIFFAFIFYTSQQFSRHIALIRSANQTLVSAQTFIQRSASTLTLENITHKLKKISTVLEKLDENQQALFIEKYIFTRDSNLEFQLQNIYHQILTEQWLPRITQRLQQYTQSHLSTEPANAYLAFTLYLMLSQPDWPVDSAYLNAHLADFIDPAFLPLKLWPKNLQKNIVVIDENSLFIKNSRDFFLTLPADKLAYILLFSTLNTHHSLNITTTLEKNQPALTIENKFSFIPNIYTAKLFTTIYKKRLPSVVKEALHGNKVLGHYHRKNIIENDLLLSLQKEYLQSYGDAWQQAIDQINLTQTNTLQEFSTQLKILTRVDSPILSLLNLAQTNTLIPEIEQISPFLSAFNQVLTPKSTPQNNDLYHSFSFLLKLRDEILSIEKSDNQTTTACMLLAQEYASSNVNPSNAQQILYLASQLPQPIQRWWLQIAQTYYTLLKQNATEC